MGVLSREKCSESDQATIQGVVVQQRHISEQQERRLTDAKQGLLERDALAQLKRT